MFRSSSKIPEEARIRIADTLNARLADGLDLHSHLKVAHWNVRGPLFPSLHPLLETFAMSLAAYNDAVAERLVTLGGRALGTVRHTARTSTLVEYPQETTRDVEHMRHIADRIESYLDGLKASRARVEELEDADTTDLLTGIIVAFEKHSWFLRASLDA